MQDLLDLNLTKGLSNLGESFFDNHGFEQKNTTRGRLTSFVDLSGNLARSIASDKAPRGFSTFSKSVDSGNIVQVSANFHGIQGFGSRIIFPVLDAGVSNLLAQVDGLGGSSPNQGSADQVSVPATHLNSCCCSSCSSGRLIDSGSAFKTAGSKWSQPSGKGSPVTITYAFDNQLSLNGLSNGQLKSLFKEALQTWANYAPLNFVEIQDPGNGRNVDILVQDDYVDGPSNTLAFAYFPGGGDITFDDGERWNASLFLETAVHELGHSLGLDHESGTSAIMNPTIQNRFSGPGDAFLFQDDINGIHSLYGSGKGSVKSLNGPPTPKPTPSPSGNLVINGSFENSSVAPRHHGIFKNIEGWTTTVGHGIQVDKLSHKYGAAADGQAWVELDSSNNSGMRQDIVTKAGKAYELSFEYTPRRGLASDTNGIEVYWDGQLVDTVTGDGGSQNNWRTFTYKVKGGNGDTTGLEFRATGVSDKEGGFLDNVVVKQVSNQTPSPTPTPTPQPTSETDRFDQAVLKLVNQERAKVSLNPLTLNEKLDQAADQFSATMAAQDFFSHTGRDGSSPGDRIAQTGYRARTWGENIAAGQRSAEEVVRTWMNSSGHRANILNPNFTEMGLGYKSLRNDTGSINYGTYWTQDFGASRGSATGGNAQGDALLDNGQTEPSESSELLTSQIDAYPLGSASEQTSRINGWQPSGKDVLSGEMSTIPDFLESHEHHTHLGV